MSPPHDTSTNADTDSPEPASVSIPVPQKNSSKAKSGSPTPDRAYAPVPLEDPKNQIRLLRFVAGLGDTPLAVQTSVWSLDEAPPYVAISYTWGEPKPRTILIDGVIAHVGHNAYTSLRQVQLHYRCLHVWIDSICINQNDDVEKSAQVAMMFQIYQRAQHVATCLGPHFGDTEWLFAVANCFRLPDLRLDVWALKLCSPMSLPSEALRKFVSAMFRALGPSVCLRILAAAEELDLHPYWQRLWVVQELAAAPCDVTLLCGAQQVSAVVLRSFYGLLWQQWPASERAYDRVPGLGVAERVLRIVGPDIRQRQRRTFQVNFNCFRHLDCTDPRDRIFALVGFTDWEQSGHSRISPDYTKSAWDLVLEVERLMTAGSVLALVQSLGITHESEEIVALLQKQRNRSTIETELHAHWDLPEIAVQTFRNSVCTRLRATSSGELCVDLDPFDCMLETGVHPFKKPDDALLLIARPVFGTDGVLNAFVCSDALPDDILIPFKGFLGLLLIVRASKTKNMHYDIIGRGFKVHGSYAKNLEDGPCPVGQCRCPSELFAKQSIFTAEVQVALTIKELILLATKWLQRSELRDSSPESNMAIRIKTMVIDIVARPRNAVSITNITCLGVYESIKRG